MKKLILIALFLFALSSVAAAAPLMEFDKGKVALDYTYRPSLDFSADAKIGGTLFGESGSISGSRNFDGDANLDLGITIGIGNKWGLQYRQYNPAGTIWSGSFGFGQNYAAMSTAEYDPVTINLGFEGKIRSDEFNLLYGFDKNWAAFVGVVRNSAGIKTSLSGSGYGYSGSLTIPELWSEEKNHFHFGVVGSYKIADKTNLWGLASFGGDYRNWEAGVSYDIGKDLQLNVNYRDTKFDKFKFAGVNFNTPDPANSTAIDVTSDVTVKGWGFGITYKF